MEGDDEDGATLTLRGMAGAVVVDAIALLRVSAKSGRMGMARYSHYLVDSRAWTEKCWNITTSAEKKKGLCELETIC